MMKWGVGRKKVRAEAEARRRMVLGDVEDRVR